MMATYARYRHVELDRVGLGKKRVLKPPGGGSSISFNEDDSLSHIKSKSAPQQETPKNDNQEQQSPKAETNGTSSPPQTPKENGTNSVKENCPSTATTNGVALNGTVTNGTTSGSTTPNSSRLDTQSRLFGDEPQKEMSNRRVRDHHRSNIFTNAAEDVSAKPANPVGSETPEPKTPEAKVPEQTQPQIQPQQRQRVPPGGFSTKLW